MMRWLRVLWMRVVRGRLASRDFEAELQSHIEMHTDAGVRAGLTPERARRDALMRLGGGDQARHTYRERVSLPWLETLRYDIVYALRGFRLNPMFTVTTILTLAL